MSSIEIFIFNQGRMKTATDIDWYVSVKCQIWNISHPLTNLQRIGDCYAKCLITNIQHFRHHKDAQSIWGKTSFSEVSLMLNGCISCLNDLNSNPTLSEETTERGVRSYKYCRVLLTKHQHPAWRGSSLSLLRLLSSEILSEDALISLPGPTMCAILLLDFKLGS